MVTLHYILRFHPFLFRFHRFSMLFICKRRFIVVDDLSRSISITLVISVCMCLSIIPISFIKGNDLLGLGLCSKVVLLCNRMTELMACVICDYLILQNGFCVTFCICTISHFPLYTFYRVDKYFTIFMQIFYKI